MGPDCLPSNLSYKYLLSTEYTLHMMQMLDGACWSIPQMFSEHLLRARVTAGGMGELVQGNSQREPHGSRRKASPNSIL